MKTSKDGIIFKVEQGVEFYVDNTVWTVPEVLIQPSEWVCFVPESGETSKDSFIELAKIFATLSAPKSGRIVLFEKDIYKISYDSLIEIRKKIGFVQSYGGLLSNRSLYENIRFPLLVHTERSYDEINIKIDYFMDILGLSPYKEHKPHQIDGRRRWQTCVARALIFDPEWLVFEDIGDWSYKAGKGIVWSYLKDQIGSPMALIVCLSQSNLLFEKWFSDLGGKIIRIFPRNNTIG
ncbi:MAG: hypothetical protein HQK77_01730 [Desulfobacterales bacterium]|nr:hypothetical protein [Desulfobacterales bacterium]